jgi:hypothetical protein
MRPMLTLQRRHSERCPDKEKGPNYLNCRRRCPLRISGMVNGRRVRTSLKTRDVRRAWRRLAELQEESLNRPRKKLSEAVKGFHDQHVRRPRDPKSTQAQLRHADPSITLKHYQKSIPASVKAAAIALENDLNGLNSDRVLSGSAIQ